MTNLEKDFFMVGSSIKRLRKSRNLTQRDLAGKLGISRQAICMWEADKRELKASMLNKIARILGVTVDEIISSPVINDFRKEVDIDMKCKSAKTITTTARKEETMPMKSRLLDISFELIAPTANRVSLTGDFNSWDEKGIPMRRSKTGSWRTVVNLKPGRYEYKFIVDGQWWTDPANNNIIRNSFGTLNSVKEVTE